MKKSVFILSATCCVLGIGSVTHAQLVNVDVGLRIGPPAPIVVRRAPPRPIPERIIVSPGPDYVWVSGRHSWRNGDWVWERGTWVRPPRPGAIWVESRWDDRTQNWVEGYWNVPPPPVHDRGERVAIEDRQGWDRAEVRVVDAPPPLRREVRIARPSRNHVWVDGYWVRRRRHYEWVPGHWDLPPRGHGHWVSPRWERRNGSYIFIEGRWR